MSPQVLRAAFARFRQTGELPDDVEVARRIVYRSETGVDATAFGADPSSQAARLREEVHGLMTRADPVMDALRQEAVHAPEPARSAARQILMAMARDGHDPSESCYRNNGIPAPAMTCASMALSILGFPHCLVTEPYRERANKLFARLDDMRARIEPDHDAWMPRFHEALERFSIDGDLPEDELLLQGVLADAELVGAVGTARGCPGPSERAGRSGDSTRGRRAVLIRVG
jgi:hypothetical protein